ncbi:ubiquitin-activating enzyme E1 C [Clonorchis sinensis]|uniref:Ubiquitin-activating enzyme E1 C n=1 Tax=Clonorchis sinensis TaxID=79923 RepID=H2KVT8_CLOSI|nr:ubiquitin-activating enzyme E1 C [Clonorchis sinensis]
MACNNVPKDLHFTSKDTLRDLVEFLKTSTQYQMRSPSVTTVADGANKSLFIDLPDFESALRPNLSKTLAELDLHDGQLLSISDSTTPRTLSFRLRLDQNVDNMITD